jgi:hypothetical protein
MIAVFVLFFPRGAIGQGVVQRWDSWKLAIEAPARGLPVVSIGSNRKTGDGFSSDVNCNEKQPASTPPRSENLRSNNPQTNHHNKPADLKTARGRTIRRSTTNTRGDQPSNLIPHDKDHAGDP